MGPTSILFLCFILHPVAGRTIAYYIWDGMKDLSLDQLRADTWYTNVFLKPGKGTQGFVMLEYYDHSQTLEVIGVRRPLGDELWVPDNELVAGTERKKFCSLALPTVIRDFINKTQFPVRYLVIEDQSRNRVGSCKCYSRTMVELGFNLIDDREQSAEELVSVCTKRVQFRFQGARANSDPQKLSVDPARDQYCLEILKKSYAVFDHNPYG